MRKSTKEWTLEAMDETRVYVTDRRSVAIEQQDALGNEPSLILIPRTHVLNVIKFLQEAYCETGDLDKSDEEELAAAKLRPLPEQPQKSSSVGATVTSVWNHRSVAEDKFPEEH